MGRLPWAGSPGPAPLGRLPWAGSPGRAGHSERVGAGPGVLLTDMRDLPGEVLSVNLLPLLSLKLMLNRLHGLLFEGAFIFPRSPAADV